jgi:hypothetical protein
MFNGLKRWADRNQGLHDAADISAESMVPPAGWEPVEAFDASETMEEED